jgi:protein-arginine deiminase
VDKRTIFQVLGQPSRTNFPALSGQIILRAATNLTVYHSGQRDWMPFEINSPINAADELESRLLVNGDQPGLGTAVLEHRINETIVNQIELELYTLKLQLINDANRDGKVDSTETNCNNWVWGENSPGAILLVNNDRDLSDFNPSSESLSELSELVLAPTGCTDLPKGVEIVLYATPDAAKRFCVYKKTIDGFRRILGKDPLLADSNAISISAPLAATGETFFVEALQYPGSFFEGLITIEVHLRHNGVVIGTDQVVFRVAPWIMTPNTLPVEKVYTCEISEDFFNPNTNFLKQLREALDELDIPLIILPPSQHNGDRWIQDEIEFGYCESSSHILPVVFDSPRDRELDGFPEAELLNPDFGHFQMGGSTPNSLDSFGNLEVSPPVTVNGREYPLGRIVFGGRKYGDFGEETRQMMPQIRSFLYAQKVQSPIEIYTDWLAVGHVDEIICFIPANNAKGFKVLLASPGSCLALLQSLSNDGYGSTLMFEGQNRNSPDSSFSAEITIDQLLDDQEFWEANAVFQRHMDLNRKILKLELGLDESDLIDIPVLFYPPAKERTLAYFPDMINHLVIGNVSLVPKPYGPIINGECAFEAAFRKAVPEQTCKFIDNWYPYHEMSGEVHCGTNTLRSPFTHKKWWEFKPDGAFDI